MQKFADQTGLLTRAAQQRFQSHDRDEAVARTKTIMLRAGRSISSRLTLWYSCVYLAGMVLFGAAMWFTLAHTLRNVRTRTLERRADRLIEVLRKTENDSPEQREKKVRTFAEATGNGLLEVFRPDGSRAVPSPGESARSFSWPKSAWPQSGNPGRDRFTQTVFSGQPYYVLERTWLSPAGPLILSLAAPLENNFMVLRTFLIALLWTVPALLTLSALGGYSVSCRALRPVDRITAATRSISINNLSERLPVPATGDELQRLSETCNAMLGRIDSAVGEIRRFTADASHELRTPLSVVRTVAELALRNPGADRESRRSFAEIVDEIAGASRVLEGMLLLARADDGSAHLSFEPVDLAEIVRVVGAKAGAMAESKGHSLSVSLPSGELPLVHGDYSMLQRLLWILIDNAVKYSHRPGAIRIVLTEAGWTESGERLKVGVLDTGMGISPSDLPHVFERFFRAERSRGQVEGAGLGLAIARWIADTHQAELTVESQERAGSAFWISIPTAQRFGGDDSPGPEDAGVDSVTSVDLCHSRGAIDKHTEALR
jgi:signal transduction histidine kinase